MVDEIEVDTFKCETCIHEPKMAEDYPCSDCIHNPYAEAGDHYEEAK